MEIDEPSLQANGGLHTSSPRLIQEPKQDVTSVKSLTIKSPLHVVTCRLRSRSLSPMSSPNAKKDEIGSMPALPMHDYYDRAEIDVSPVKQKSSNEHDIKSDKIHIRLPHAGPYPGYTIVHHTPLSQQLPPPQHDIPSTHLDMDGVLNAPPPQPVLPSILSDMDGVLNAPPSLHSSVSPCEKDPHIVVSQSGQHARGVQNPISISDVGVEIGGVSGIFDKVRIGSLTGSLDKVTVGSPSRICGRLEVSTSRHCVDIIIPKTGDHGFESPEASQHQWKASENDRTGSTRDKKVTVCTFSFASNDV